MNKDHKSQEVKACAVVFTAPEGHVFLVQQEEFWHFPTRYVATSNGEPIQQLLRIFEFDGYNFEVVELGKVQSPEGLLRVVQVKLLRVPSVKRGQWFLETALPECAPEALSILSLLAPKSELMAA